MSEGIGAKGAVGKARRKRLPRAEREKQILQAAVLMFSQQGYDGTSMNDVAATCGITKPILYSHFGSKDGLFAAAMSEVARDLVEALVHVLHEPDPTLRLKQAVAVSLDEMARIRGEVPNPGGNATYANIVMQQLEHYRAEILLAIVEAVMAIKPEGLSRERAQPICEYYAHLMFGGAMATGGWWADTQMIDMVALKDKAARYVDFIVALMTEDMRAALEEGGQDA